MPLEQCEECPPEGLRLESGDGAMATADKFLHAAPPEIYLQEFAVRYEYPVAFTRDLFSPANRLFVETLARLESNGRHKIIVFIDGGLAAGENLPSRVSAYAAVHKHAIELVAPPEFIPGGERCKNDPALVERLQGRLVELALDRHAFVVAIGGGAMLDLVGYVAATVHRGIRHIRVPTTVLSQNDSGVGVKNGVNAFGQKNLLGAFAPPFAVLNDSAFLDGLDERDKRAGMAEAVKVALIRDAAFFRWLERNAADLRAFRAGAVDYLIRRCAELHMVQIASGGDPFERGSARPLDFGHWSAHKVELMTGHALRHGEAVAIGIALDARYSVLSRHLRDGEDRRVCRLLRALGLPVFHPTLKDADSSGDYRLLGGLRDFREHLGGELTITLLAGLGEGVEVHEMDQRLILQAINWLEAVAE
jgi:3-dehydroquinate synthase